MWLELFFIESSVHRKTICHLCQNGFEREGGAISNYTGLKGIIKRSHQSFPGSSAAKESSCNAWDPSLIPGLGRSLGEGIGNPLHYSWASLVVQTVKNLPEMQETWVWSLGREDPLEEGMVIHSSILAWIIPMYRGAWRATAHGVVKSRTWLSD